MKSDRENPAAFSLSESETWEKNTKEYKRIQHHKLQSKDIQTIFHRLVSCAGLWVMSFRASIHVLLLICGL